MNDQSSRYTVLTEKNSKCYNALNINHVPWITFRELSHFSSDFLLHTYFCFNSRQYFCYFRAAIRYKLTIRTYVRLTASFSAQLRTVVRSAIMANG